MRQLAVWALAVVLWVAPVAAQTSVDLVDLNVRAVEAFRNGDVPTALSLIEEAAAAPKADALAMRDAYYFALQNLSFLMLDHTGDLARALDAADRALAFAEETGIKPGKERVLVLANRAAALAGLGDPRAGAALEALMAAGRGTDVHGRTVGLALDIAFAMRDYPKLAQLAEEMVAVSGAWSAKTDLTALSDRQTEVEALGDAEAVGALIDARINWVEVAQPDLRDRFAHAALWSKFHVLHENEQFGPASDALRFWASTGDMSPGEQLFLSQMAENSLLLTQLSGYGTQSGVQLGYAELTVTFAELAYAPDDVRLARALRERAAAEGAVGLFARAEATLQDALAILVQSDEGRRERHLVLESLGNLAMERGDAPGALALYVEADAAYQKALVDGADPLGDYDLSVIALNRARLALDLGNTEVAVEALGAASEAFDRAGDAGGMKPDQFWHLVAIAQTTANITAVRGQTDAALDATRGWIEAIHEYFPELHPRKARALANASDQLFALGATDEAAEVLSDAAQVARRTVPLDAAPQAETTFKAALYAVVDGDRAQALTLLREVAEIWKSPQNRPQLAGAAWEFELLAWALLDQADPTEQDIDEALAALQWTHMSRSSEALAAMGARLAAEDPAQATLLKARQDAQNAALRNRSILAGALANGDETDALLDRQATLDAAVAQADRALNDLGLGLTGVAPVSPLSLAEVQALLRPGEVLVTFLLPGLKPDAISGLDTSANSAIAITHDGFTVAPIPEDSRGALNETVSAFRCELAISDPGCGAESAAAGLRGAMLETEEAPQDPPFDYALAYGLYQQLLGGIDHVLAGAERLVIVPPSDLLRLPFAALLTGPDSGAGLAKAPWLVRRQAISVLPSFPALAILRQDAARTAPRPMRFIGIGDPVIGTAAPATCSALAPGALRSANALSAAPTGPIRDGMRLADPAKLARLERLPDTACELEAIRDAIGPDRSQIFLDAAANETQVKTLDEAGALSQADVLVFATHGLVAGEAGASAPGLVLTPPETATPRDDGLLTAAEVATLTLDARLVVLSACNTAAGEEPGGEGLSGLAGSFIHAGARALMVTHWSVYSEASARVSSSVLAALAADPELDNSAALRRATLDLLDGSTTPLTRHPAWWAPFAIIGD